MFRLQQKQRHVGTDNISTASSRLTGPKVHYVPQILNKLYDPLKEPHNSICLFITGLIIGLRPANEILRYKLTPPLTGWAQT